MTRDSFVRCDDCGAEQYVDFATGLRSGWPKCYCRDAKYGLTMRLVRTDADIAVATASVIDSQLGGDRAP